MKNLDLQQVIDGIVPVSAEFEEKATEHAKALAMPTWALGKLLDLGVKLAGIQQTLDLDVSKKRIYTFAGDHGVADEGVSAYPQVVTLEMAKNIVNGGAGVNVLGRASGAEVQLVDMGMKGDFPHLVEEGKIIDAKLGYGTNNMRIGPAMTREQAIAGLEAGIRVATKAIKEDGVKLLGTGDLGIGNTTPSAAILAVIGGYKVDDITGRGTGVDDTGLINKIKVIEDAIALNKPNPKDGVDVLAKVGGFEIAGIAGLILGAAYNQVPVVVDGFISTAGALIAKSVCPASVAYMIPSHRSQEPGHIKMLETLGLEPIIDLDFRLGEGTGGAMTMHVVESAVRIMCDMLTFEQAQVSDNLS